MKNLIIIGAGGLGRTIYNWALESIGYGVEFLVKGFLDDNLMSLETFEGYPPIISTISAYQPLESDVFVCAIGGSARTVVNESIMAKKGRYINLLHRSVRIGTNAEMGYGNVLGPNVSLGPDTKMGNLNFIQNETIIGHDVEIGDLNRLDTRIMCVGGVRIKNRTTIHSSAVLNHKVVVEDDAVVGACSFVIRRVKSGTTVFGIPAKQM